MAASRFDSRTRRKACCRFCKATARLCMVEDCFVVGLEKLKAGGAFSETHSQGSSFGWQRRDEFTSLGGIQCVLCDRCCSQRY